MNVEDYRADLLFSAQIIMNDAELYDDLKARHDYIWIDQLLANIRKGKNNAIVYDAKYREDYPVIEQIERISNYHPESIYDRLISDLYGIHADVLIRHSIICDVTQLVMFLTSPVS